MAVIATPAQILRHREIWRRINMLIIATPRLTEAALHEEFWKIVYPAILARIRLLHLPYKGNLENNIGYKNQTLSPMMVRSVIGAFVEYAADLEFGTPPQEQADLIVQAPKIYQWVLHKKHPGISPAGAALATFYILRKFSISGSDPHPFLWPAFTTVDQIYGAQIMHNLFARMVHYVRTI